LRWSTAGSEEEDEKFIHLRLKRNRKIKDEMSGRSTAKGKRKTTHSEIFFVEEIFPFKRKRDHRNEGN